MNTKKQAALLLRELGRLNGVLNVESLHFHKMKGLIQKVNQADFIDYLCFLIRNNQDGPLNRIRYYFRMFLELKPVQEIINSPDFPGAVLEDMLLESFCVKAVTKSGEMEQVFDEGWNFLSPEKSLGLLLDGPLVSRDLHLSMNLLIFLDTAHFDRFLMVKEGVENFILDIVNLIPQELISHIFLRYPVFYGYVYWILSTHDFPEAHQALKRFESEINEAKQADSIAHNIQKTRVNTVPAKIEKSEDLMSSIRTLEWKKLLSIRDQLRGVKDAHRILALLKSRNVIQTALEFKVLEQLLLADSVLEQKVG